MKGTSKRVDYYRNVTTIMLTQQADGVCLCLRVSI